MDLLQLVHLLEILVMKVLLPQFWNENKLTNAMQQYELWSGHALVGGLFQSSQLLRKHEYMVMFNAL